METSPQKESLHRSKVLRGVNSRLRHLDVDDLYLLTFLGEGKRLADVARALSLSQPAITQRVHKIEQTLGLALLERSSRGTRLTESGLSMCRHAREAMVQLEKFFDNVPRNGFSVAVTSAWCAWLMAAAITTLPDQSSSIDVEYLSPDVLQRGIRAGEEFANVIVTLHRRSDHAEPPGLVPVAHVLRPITLWGRPGINLAAETTPMPIIEVSREEFLLTPQQIEQLEADYPTIRGVRYAGTVAGAAKLAAKGHGLLVAPQNESELGLGLYPIQLNKPIGVLEFNLYVDERVPICDLTRQLVAIFTA